MAGGDILAGAIALMDHLPHDEVEKYADAVATGIDIALEAVNANREADPRHVILSVLDVFNKHVPSGKAFTK